MSTSTVDPGSILSRVTHEHAAVGNANLSSSNARQPTLRGVDRTSASTTRADVEQDSQAQRAQLNEALDQVSRLEQRLSFRIDESSGKSVVVVRDAQTLEVLKQFPSEEMLNVARRLAEHLEQSGASAGALHTEEV